MPNTALIFSNNITYSGSHPQMFFKIGVRKNFANFTGKKPLLESLFNKVAETPTQVFSCEITKIFKNTSGGCFCTYCTHRRHMQSG